jgi:hypothetical protein
LSSGAQGLTSLMALDDVLADRVGDRSGHASPLVTARVYAHALPRISTKKRPKEAVNFFTATVLATIRDQRHTGMGNARPITITVCCVAFEDAMSTVSGFWNELSGLVQSHFTRHHSHHFNPLLKSATWML